MLSQPIPLYLTPEQRAQLETGLKNGSAPARVQTRARILLPADRSIGQFRTDPEIAEALLFSQTTVGNIHKRFLTEGLQAALSEKPHPGCSPRITGEIEAQIVVRACSDPPEHGCVRTLGVGAPLGGVVTAG